MTDRLHDAVKRAEEELVIKKDKQLLIDWLDDKVQVVWATQLMRANSPKSLCMGKLDPEKGEYEIDIESCFWLEDAKLEVHIFRGLPLLADAVNAKIYTRPHGEDRICNYFNYNGVEFFELSKEGEELK